MANLSGENGSFLVLFKDKSKKQVFMVYRTDYPIWVLTGGGIEPEETPQQAAAREAYEETGFSVKDVKPVGEYRYVHRSTFLFEGIYASGQYKPEFDGNIGKWFPVNKLPQDITSSTRQKVFDALHHSGQPFVKTIKDELPLSQNLLLVLRHPKAFVKFVNKKFLHHN